jgi:hypothetical protein
MRVGPSKSTVRGRLQTTASCDGKGPWWCCVKKTRERHALREIKEDPSEPSCRGRLQTATSYGVAQRELLPDVEHPQSRYLNNRAENSHRPTRRRERQMQRFKSPRQAQRFLSAHSFSYGHFRPRRHLLTARSYRMMRSLIFEVWQQEMYAQNAA